MQLEVISSDIEQWAPAEGQDQEFGLDVGFLDERASVQVRGVARGGKPVGPNTIEFDALAA